MGVGGGGGIDWEYGVNRRKLLQTEWMDNKALLYIQYSQISHNGKEHEKELCVCIYIHIHIYIHIYIYN